MKFKARIARAVGVAAAMALTASMAIGGDASAAAHAAPLAVPRYYMALPGGNNFANVPGSATAVFGDTVTGKRPLTVHAPGKNKFVTVSAAADDRTFVLGANPNPQPPAVPMATEWYLVHVTTGPGLHATERKLGIPAPGKNDLVDATAVSPDGREVALVGMRDTSPTSAAWVRLYAVATGALLHSWSTPGQSFSPYTTLSWTSGGRRLAIGYTFAVTRPGSTRLWSYLGVRTLAVRSAGRDLFADSKLIWSRLTRGSGFTKPAPLNCALALRVAVSPDETVVCPAFGLLRAVNPNPFGPACPAIPKWASLGFLAFGTTGGKLARTVFEYDTNCIPGGNDVLWTSAAGDTVIGYYILGGLVPGTKPVVRFGVFSGGTYTALPMPPTIATIPNTIAW